MRAIYLIRHGATIGNEEKRYVGSTDEPLSEAGKRQIADRQATLRANMIACGLTFPKKIYVSPMLRCRQSASALFPGAQMELVPDFREKNFGEFEYKNYKELAGDSRYQAFIDSGGVLDFPGAEPQAVFLERTGRAFEQCIQDIGGGQEAFPIGEPLVFVVHGGTIMSILDRYAFPHRNYFDWQLEPLGCYCGRIEITEEKPQITNIRKL
jgi:alpha-ribazole phosphatase